MISPRSYTLLLPHCGVLASPSRIQVPRVTASILCAAIGRASSSTGLYCQDRLHHPTAPRTASRPHPTRRSLTQLCRPFTTSILLGLARQRPNVYGRLAASRHNAYHSSTRAEAHDFLQTTAKWGFVAAFILVYLALQSEGQKPVARGPITQKYPVPAISLPSSITNQLTIENLSYRRSDWPPENLRQCMPYLTHLFAHGSASHLLSNSLGFYFLTSALFPAMGALTTISTFLAGGVIASQIDCFVGKAYATGQYRDLFAYIKSGPDPSPKSTLESRSLGASSGLCTLLMAATLSAPSARWSLLFIPVGIPLFLITSAEVAWEAWSYYENVADGVSHSGHLAGHLAGVVLWFGVLRWTPYGRICRGVYRW